MSTINTTTAPTQSSASALSPSMINTTNSSTSSTNSSTLLNKNNVSSTSSSSTLNNSSLNNNASLSQTTYSTNDQQHPSHLIDRTTAMKEGEVIADAERKIAEVQRLKAIQIAEVERERLEKMKSIIAATEQVKQSERLVQVAEMKKVENQRLAEQCLKEAEILRQAALERERMATQHQENITIQAQDYMQQAEQQRMAALAAIEAIPTGLQTSGGVMSKITDLHSNRDSAIIPTTAQQNSVINTGGYTRSA